MLYAHQIQFGPPETVYALRICTFSLHPGSMKGMYLFSLEQRL